MSDGTKYVGMDLADVIAQPGWIMPKSAAETAFNGIKVTNEHVNQVVKLGLKFPHGLMYVCLEEYVGQMEEKSFLEETP